MAQARETWKDDQASLDASKLVFIDDRNKHENGSNPMSMPPEPAAVLQGQIRLPRHEPQQPVLMRLQRRTALTTARSRADASGCILKPSPADRGGSTHPAT